MFLNDIFLIMNKIQNENVNSVYSHASHIYTKNRKFFRTKSYIVFIQIIYKYIYDFSILNIEVQRRICEVQINFFLHSIFLSETSFPQFPLRIFS